MNIALFTDTYPPFINGVSTSVYNLAHTLMDHGHNVIVVTTRSDDGEMEFKDNVLNDFYEIVCHQIYGRSQDYSNCLHAKTKCYLMGGKDGYIWSHAEDTAKMIYDKLEGNGPHCDYSCLNGDAKYVAGVFKYLAYTEHLRWSAFFENADFVYGKEKSFLLKTHKYMVPMKTLDDSTKHYDYLVIKTTLMLA